MIHEKGLCKVLSAAYKGGGYSVIPVRRQVETVARSWRRDGSSVMVKIPVIFRDRWQLYQTTTGAVYAFDTELLKLIDFKEVSPECRITPHGNMAMFLWGDEMVFLAPGRFSRENEEKILYIAGMDWENQVEADDPVVNLNLFNADQDEPLLTPEE